MPCILCTSLAQAASRRRSARWRWLVLAARSLRRGIFAGAAALLLLSLSVNYIIGHRLEASPESILLMPRIWRSRPAAARQVRFSQQFILIGANMRSTENGLRVELAWQSLAAQRLQYSTLVELRDTAGSLVGRAGYPTRSSVERGAERHALARYYRYPA